ncbi:Phosphofructokinase domain [Artemisia annua]|uniref:Phosphofructokinase domain n=1 Tax=Artemisia annua TaxID=35608 RepID=A0A2U1MU50_ARTAN|nr:Phosphofructokinase domain [Artemisia annua]
MQQSLGRRVLDQYKCMQVYIIEAESALNGTCLVKLMGRSTSHIALSATLSCREYLVIVQSKMVAGHDIRIEELLQNGHAVVVVTERDESGNPVVLDVRIWLKSELKSWLDKDHKGELFTVKYIDPTYMIRSVTANATTNLYCTLLAHSAIHGIMAGYTGFVAGPINKR